MVDLDQDNVVGFLVSIIGRFNNGPRYLILPNSRTLSNLLLLDPKINMPINFILSFLTAILIYRVSDLRNFKRSANRYILFLLSLLKTYRFYRAGLYLLLFFVVLRVPHYVYYIYVQ